MPFIKMHSHETLLEMGYTYERPWTNSHDTYWYSNTSGKWELWQYIHPVRTTGRSLFLECIYKPGMPQTPRQRQKMDNLPKQETEEEN